MDTKHLRFETIYTDYQQRIFAFIASEIKNETDRWDVFQEVFSKIFEKIDVLDEELNIKSYIYTTAKNKINDYFRKSKKSFSDISEMENFLTDSKNDIETRQMNSELSAAMQMLPQREKEVFEYKYFFNFKISEIAGKLKLSEGAVKRYLFDATLKLKERLK